MCACQCGVCVCFVCGGVWCVVCVVCVCWVCVLVCVGVCGVVCVVCGAAWPRSVCTGKTRACVETHVRVVPVHTEAFGTYTRILFEPTHGEEGRRRRGEEGGSLLSLSLVPSLFLSSFVLFLRTFSRSFSLLSSLLSSLSATQTMITRPVGSLSLSVNTAQTCLSVRVRGPWPIPCSHHARNNCPGITVQTSCHLE